MAISLGPPRIVLVRAALIAALLAPLAAAPADAQVWSRVGIGVRFGGVIPTDGDLTRSTFVGGSGGFVPDEGWGPALSLGWFGTDLLEAGGRSRRLGELDVRPVMGGIAYTWLRGRLATTASVTAGISFNGGSVDEALRQAAVDPALVDVEIGNSFAVRPELDVEYFPWRKLSITGSAGYLFTRPDITVRLPDREITGQWDASNFAVSAGVTVYPFR